MRQPHALPSALLAVLATLAACTPDIAQDPAPPLVTARFDPGADPPVVPTPNDLAIDPGTGLVAVPDAPDASTAQREFNAYLRTLDGFPASSVATVQMSGPLDPSSLTPASIIVLDLTGRAAIRPVQGTQLRWEAEGSRLQIVGPWEPGHRYLVAVRGGEAGVRGEGGEEVVGSAAFSLVRGSTPLVSCEDLASEVCTVNTTVIPGDSRSQQLENARRLEQLRRGLQPLIGALEARGLAREELAALWTFRITTAPLATFDPASGTLPFPNDVLRQNERVALPILPTDDAVTRALKTGLNTLDGFSLTGSLLTESGRTVGAASGRIDPASLSADQFLVLNVANPAEEVPLDVRCRGCGQAANGAGMDQIAVTPRLPLRSSTRYAVIWRRGARALQGGRPVRESPTFALTRASGPLVEEGVSQVEALNAETATRLEPLRQLTQLALGAAVARGVPREEVLLAWVFTTQSAAPSTAALAGLPRTWALPTALEGGPGALAPVDLAPLVQAGQVGADLVSNLRLAVQGAFPAGNALDRAATEVDPATGASFPTEGSFRPETLARPTLESRRFILFVPKRARQADGRIPVMVFQHGLGRSRYDAALIANTAAGEGLATLAIDAPLHGDRSVCRADDECNPGGGCAQNRCTSGYRVRPGDFGTPAISGRQFLSTTNLFATRDHFRQQVVDLAQLLRVLRDTDAGLGAIDVDDPATPAQERLDGSEVTYVGQSLGGIIGTVAMAALPELRSGALYVAGGSFADVLLTAPAFEEEKRAVERTLAARGITPGSEAYLEFFDTARWILDPADPQVFGRHLIAEPLPSVPPKRIFIGWMEGDPVIPNPTTQLLIRSIDARSAPQNLSQKRYTGGSHGFLLDFSSPARARLALEAQSDAIEWVKP